MYIPAPKDVPKLIAELRALNEELGVPSVAQFGINQDEFMNVKQTMAQQALASGSPGNNPRVPSADEIIEIYESLWA